MKRRIGLGFAVALLLLAVLVGVVGGSDVLTELSGADRSLLALGILSGVLALTFRGMVWCRFVSLVDETIPRGRIWSVFLTAMFAKYVTPYGQLATEPFVAYLVARDGEMAYESGLASVLSADLWNYVPYYTFGFVAFGLIVARDAVGNGMMIQFVAFGGLFLVLTGLVSVTVSHPPIVYRLVLGSVAVVRRTIGRITSRFDDRLTPTAIRARLDGFYGSIDTIAGDWRSILVATVYAHLGMAFLMLPVYLGAAALGYELALPVVALTVALGKLGSVVPAPGGTGGVEAMVTATLTTLGQLEPAAALSIALVYRLCTYWLTIGVGGLAAAGLLVGES